MRKLITFALITARTGKYNMVHIMTWGKVSTRNRNCMVKMIGIRILVLLKFAEAVIASIPLCLQLILNLLYCQRSLKLLLASTTPLLVDTSLSKVYTAPSLTSLPISPAYLFPMSIAIICRPGKHLFPMFLVVLQTPCTSPIEIFPVIPPSSFIDFFIVGAQVFGLLCAYFFPVLLVAFFSIFDMSVVIAFKLVIPALLTTSVQSISIFVEELGSCRKLLLALIALLLRGILGYSITHGNAPNVIIAPLGTCNTAGAHQYLPHQYSIKLPPKQLQGVAV